MKKFTAIFLALFLIFAPIATVQAAEGELTRSDFITTINEVFHIYTVLGTGEQFSDIDFNTPHYYELMAAKEKGYISGYGDGSVRPDQPITRAEAAAALNKLLNLPQATSGVIFADQQQLPAWALDSIQRVVALEILSTDENGQFRGDVPLSREELEQAVAAIKSLGLHRREDEIITLRSFDGFQVTGRLSMPAKKDKVDKLVIFVHGTGPNTYEIRRQNDDAMIRFKYLDTYADQLVNDGIALFTYNTRGVTLGDTAPYYATIDENTYQQYTPQNIAQDIKHMIEQLKQDPRLENAQVILIGGSEGTIIAPLAVAEYGAAADALLLIGYCNDNMRDVLEYQLGGGMSFFRYTLYFNAVGEDKITKAQFEADPHQVINTLLGGVAFDDLDFNKDGVLTQEDFAILMTPIKEALFEAVDRGDDQWVKENMMTIIPPLMTTWFKAHFELPKTEEIMTKVDLPIYIFQGTYDANCPVQGTYDVQARFEALGKDNLTVNVYEGYDHDLNYTQYIYGIGSQAFDDLFMTVKTLQLPGK